MGKRKTIHIDRKLYRRAKADAARLGVYLHGLSGDLAAGQLGQESLIATDLIRFLPDAFRQYRRR